VKCLKPQPSKTAFLPTSPLGSDDLSTTSPARNKVGDHFGLILQIAIHENDDVSVSMHQPCCNRRLMAEVARKLQDGKSGVGLMLIDHNAQRPVHASIIDVDHLPVEAIEATTHLSKATLQLP
jgi:hypothetical protein